MQETPEEKEEAVRCHVCGAEVPRSAARSAEGRDYRYYFCGGGCEQRWSANRHVEDEAEKRH